MYNDDQLQHPDVTNLRESGMIDHPIPTEEPNLCVCGKPCAYLMCNDCYSRAVIDSETRITYLNSGGIDIEDYMDATRVFATETDFPVDIGGMAMLMGITSNALENIPIDDHWALIPSCWYINEDRKDFEDWYVQTHCVY